MGNELIVRDPDKLKLWIGRIEECKKSGETVTEWCKRKGISLKSYYYWHRRIMRFCEGENTGTERDSFYEIPQVTEMYDAGKKVGAIVVGPVKAEIYTGADAETLAALIKAMRSC